MPWKRSFEAFVEATLEAKSVERLYELLLESVGSYGFDQLNFTVQQDTDLPGPFRGFGIISTYPKIWQSYYAVEYHRELALTHICCCLVGASR